MRQDGWKVGVCCLLLALGLRFGSQAVATVQPLLSRQAADFLLYLHTGLRLEEKEAISLSYAPESPAPAGAKEPVLKPLPVITAETVPVETQPEPTAPFFTAQDGAQAAIDNDAGVALDPESWILTPPELPSEPGPKVLIYSTHATESYTKNGENYTETAAYRTLSSGFNMLSLGARLQERLEALGIEVLRDETLHDYPSYNSAYVSSRKSVQAYLEEYPSLALVLDLHRDAASGKQQLRPLAETASGTAARLMLVVGTNAGGRSHPDWQKNCALALRLQTLLECRSPGITRPINLRAQRFNQDLSPGALLIEIGGAGNTHAEALTAVDLLAQAIAELLQ